MGKVYSVDLSLIWIIELIRPFSFEAVRFPPSEFNRISSRLLPLLEIWNISN